MPKITYEDLDQAQQNAIAEAIKVALTGVGDARKALEGAKRRPSQRVRRHFKIGGCGAEDLADISRIIGRYHLIQEALRGHRLLHFDGEQTGPYLLGSVTAYVWSTTPPARGERGVIKIVKSGFFARRGESRARALIHEVGHRFAGLDGDTYRDAGAFVRLTREEAMRNADSYAFFALPGPRAPGIRVKMP